MLVQQQNHIMSESSQLNREACTGTVNEMHT